MLHLKTLSFFITQTVKQYHPAVKSFSSCHSGTQCLYKLDYKLYIKISQPQNNSSISNNPFYQKNLSGKSHKEKRLCRISL